jgi:hypothetical protein
MSEEQIEAIINQRWPDHRVTGGGERMTSPAFDLQISATEIEIAEAIKVSDPDVADTIRRLAFQRDRLVTEIERLQAIVNKLPHMDDIETAILAINCGSGDEFREDFCQCDHEVGVTMCVHCAVWDVLRKVKAARRAGEVKDATPIDT